VKEQMRSLTAISVIAIASGFAMLALSVAAGDAEVGLFVIFPYVAAHGAVSALGVGLIFLGTLLFFISIASSIASCRGKATIEKTEGAAPEARKERKIGGVVLIGPVPIIFGSDRDMARSMIVFAVILAILMIALYSLILLF